MPSAAPIVKKTSKPAPFVTPQIALAAASTRREQDVRIQRLVGAASMARREGRTNIVVSARDLECVLAEIKIPLDLERARA